MMTDTPQRCEPPEEGRHKASWHWLSDEFNCIQPVWLSVPNVFPKQDCYWRISDNIYSPPYAAECGYRYIAPVLTPAEITEREAAAYRRGQREMRNAAGNAVADCYFQECCGEPMQDGECCGIARIVFSPEAAQSLGETIAALPIKEKPE